MPRLAIELPDYRDLDSDVLAKLATDLEWVSQSLREDHCVALAEYYDLCVIVARLVLWTRHEPQPRFASPEHLGADQALGERE